MNTYRFDTGTHAIKLEVTEDHITVRIATTNAYGNLTSEWVPPSQSYFYRDKTMALEEVVRQLLNATEFTTLQDLCTEVLRP